MRQFFIGRHVEAASCCFSKCGKMPHLRELAFRSAAGYVDKRWEFRNTFSALIGGHIWRFFRQ